MEINRLNPLNRVIATITIIVGLLATSTLSANDNVASFVRSVLGNSVEVISVKPSELDGFYIATMQDLSILYVSEDLRWILIGDLIEAKPGAERVFLRHTEMHRNAVRLEKINNLKTTDVIAFAPPFEQPKAVVHVFTDTTCGYCQKLHSEIADYHSKGIEIRYLAYPRSGIGSESYDAMVSAWCASNPHVALTQLKQGSDIERLTCKNPVAAQFQLGQQLGLRGTPMILLGNGKTVGGYVNADELAEILISEGLL